MDQGFNGVSVADRTVRQLGIEVANTQISLATQNAKLEEIAEAASLVNLELWEETMLPALDTAHEGGPTPLPSPGRRFVVPDYQVEAVVRLLSLLRPR